jgi:hypothetical protein
VSCSFENKRINLTRLPNFSDTNLSNEEAIKGYFCFLFYISTVMVSKGAETNCLDFVMQLFAQKGLFFTKELFFGRVARANYKSF